MEERIVECLEKAKKEIQDRKSKIDELNKQKRTNAEKRKNLLQVKKMFGKDEVVYKVADEESKEKLKLIKEAKKEITNLKEEISDFKFIMTRVVGLQKEIEEREKRIEEIKKERQSVLEERKKLLKVRKLFDKEDKVYVVARQEDKEKIKMLKEKSKELIQLNEEIEDYKEELEHWQVILDLKINVKEQPELNWIKPVSEPPQPAFVSEPPQPAFVSEPPQPAFVSEPPQPAFVSEPPEPAFVSEPPELVPNPEVYVEPPVKKEPEIEVPDLDEDLVNEPSPKAPETTTLTDEQKKVAIAKKIEEGRRLQQKAKEEEEASSILDTLEVPDIPEETQQDNKKLQIVIGRTVNVINGENISKLSIYEVKNVSKIANGIGVMEILSDNGINTEDIDNRDVQRLFNERLVDPIVVKALATNRTLTKEERHDIIKQYIAGDVSNISIVYDAKALSKSHILSKLLGNTELENSDKSRILEFGEKAKENELAQVKGKYKLGFLEKAINFGKSLFSKEKKFPKFPGKGKGDPKPKEETPKAPEQEPKDGKKAFEDELSRNGELKGAGTINTSEISENVINAYNRYKVILTGDIGQTLIKTVQPKELGLSTQGELEQFKKLYDNDYEQGLLKDPDESELGIV